MKPIRNSTWHSMANWRVIAACLALIVVTVGSAAPSPTLIPFQGRLTNPQGVAYTTGQYTISFTLYDQPVGGTVLWAETHAKVGVINGMVNVFLGSIVPFDNPGQGRPPVTFAETRHLGITIDADNNPNTADPEMVPRQMIIPAFWAKFAENADTLDGYDWNNPAPGVTVPVGGVIMWWGSVANMPVNFELCDGSAPSTSGATLSGLKPDLRDRFPKGALPGTQNVQSTPTTGGSHTIAQGVSGGTAITVAQMPSHGHSVTDPGHSHGTTAGSNFGVSGNSPSQNVVNYVPSAQTSTSGANITLQNTGGSLAHDHTIPAHDNRPVFLEMFFIIRVK